MSISKQPSIQPFVSRLPEGPIAVLILMAGLLALLFPDFFQAPNSRVIEPYGDGYKVYAVMEYHARHDSSYTCFEGMNYPYGEHVIPADAMPLLSNTIKFISEQLVDITAYTRGILHISLLLSLLLAALFLYLILERLGSNSWWAVAVAIGLTFLSPQLHRMTSHYGLSYVAAFPILLYLLLRLEESHSWRMSAWIAVAVTAFSLLHFYYFAIFAFFLSFYFLVGFLRRPSLQRLLRYAFHYSIQLLIPLLFFYFWMYHGDAGSGRTDKPWGFFVFHSIWEGVFTSLFQPHFQWVDEHLIKIEEVEFEGMAYVGLVSTIGTLVLLGRWVAGGFRRPIVRAGGQGDNFLNKIFWASVVLLLFSFGYPFTIPGLEGLLDYTGPIRQFRSVGRFNWAFYYVINLIVFLELWEWAQKEKWRLAVGVLAVLLLYFEAYQFVSAKDFRLDEVKELEEGQKYTDIPGINYEEFQAILTVPYFNVGSDNIWFHGEGEILPRALTLSVQTGLPTTSAMLTRTPLWQTLKQVQLVLEPYRPPLLLEDFPNDKPLLLMAAHYQFGQQKEKYQHLMDGSQLLYENESYSLYRLPLRNFRERIEARKRRIALTLDADSLALNAYGPFLSREGRQNFYYNAYDSLSSDKAYRGSGGLQGKGNAENVLFDGAIPGQSAGGWYTFSAWMYLGDDLRPRSDVHITEYRREEGGEVQRQGFFAYSHIRVLDSNGWGLLEFRFIPQLADSRIVFSIRNAEIGEGPLYFDELLIRQEVSEIYRRGEDYLWKNNRWFPF